MSAVDESYGVSTARMHHLNLWQKERVKVKYVNTERCLNNQSVYSTSLL